MGAQLDGTVSGTQDRTLCTHVCTTPKVMHDWQWIWALMASTHALEKPEAPQVGPIYLRQSP